MNPFDKLTDVQKAFYEGYDHGYQAGQKSMIDLPENDSIPKLKDHYVHIHGLTEEGRNSPELAEAFKEIIKAIMGKNYVELQKQSAKEYQRLFNYFADEHGLILIQSEMDEIIHEVERHKERLKNGSIHEKRG